jgi:xanthine dehydrogenase accessory factor
VRAAAGILQLILERCADSRAFAVVTILRAEGSTPAKAGAKAIVEANGSIRGTIGGGRVEAEAQRQAVQAIQHGQPLVFDFQLQGADAEADSPICGGAMRVLVDPTALQHRAAFAQALAALSQRQRGVLLTTVRGGPPLDVHVRWVTEPKAGDSASLLGSAEAQEALRRGEAGLVVQEATHPGGPWEVLLEPVGPRPLLLIAGGGHVGQAVAWQAGLVGFEVTVLDDREEFCRPDLFPTGTVTRCAPMAEELRRLPLDHDTFVVIVTRGHAHDALVLGACLGRPAGYVGMIGSRRKVALLRQDFLDSGRATAEEFDRVYAPIGLDIGAVTVPEIATSIVAQLIAVRRQGSAPRIRMA